MTHSLVLVGTKSPNGAFCVSARADQSPGGAASGAGGGALSRWYAVHSERDRLEGISNLRNLKSEGLPPLRISISTNLYCKTWYNTLLQKTPLPAGRGR